MSFKETDINSLQFNPFTKIGKQWFLVTAGNGKAYNTMTASWGFMGFMWNKPVITTVIRTNRHTFSFIESNDYFTISFYPEECRKALSFCGSHSGRDCDKALETGLTPVHEADYTYFEQAETVFVCRKLYEQKMDTDLFTDKSLMKFYEKDPEHKAFVGEIVKVLVKEN